MISSYLTLPPQGPIRILRMHDIRDRLKLSPSHIFSLIARGQFPKPFPLVPNGRSVGWIERDIDQWILDRKKLADEGGAA